LSNTGGAAITRRSHEFWSEGRERSSLKLKDFEAIIAEGAFNEAGGLRNR